MVLGKSVAQMAKKTVPHIRLPLLSPEELRQVEDESKKDNMIPVGELCDILLFAGLV